MAYTPSPPWKRVCSLIVAIAAVPLGTLAWSSAASGAPDSVAIDLVASANPSPLFQDVTYTVTLITPDAGSLTLGDTVDMQDNGNYINGCTGLMPNVTATPGTYTVTCVESGNALSAGGHSLTVFFNGDPNYNPDTGSFRQSVSAGATETFITSPTAGSSETYGNEGNNSLNVSVSAPGVTNQSPGGSVDIYSGTPGPDTYLCTAYVNGPGNGQSTGNCYINETTLNAGAYVLSAVYNGDNTFSGSTSTPQSFTVTQVTSHMQAFAVPGYAFYGAENGNFFIEGVYGNSNGNPTGDASVTANGISLVAPGTCSVGNGGGNPCYLDSATALPASSTPYTVTSNYPGDQNFTNVSTTSSLLVLPATTTTTLSVTPTSSSSDSESSVNISATVTAGTTGAPSGAIIVQHGGIVVCTITDLRPIGTNAATGNCLALGDTQLPAGTYALTANYTGDGNYQSSTSSAQPLTVTTTLLPTGTFPQPAQTCGDTGNAAFVCGLYEDVLGRAADPAGLSNFLTQLSAGATRSAVAGELLTSTEYRRDLIASYYQEYLGRPADSGGFTTFLALFAQGASAEDVQAAIVGSAEFLNHSGGSAAEFVSALYLDVLNRPADAAGLATFTGQLAAGTTGRTVAAELLDSTEYHSELIDSYYESYLNRPADAGGISTFLNLFTLGGTNTTVQSALLGSSEFYAQAN